MEALEGDDQSASVSVSYNEESEEWKVLTCALLVSSEHGKCTNCNFPVLLYTCT